MLHTIKLKLFKYSPVAMQLHIGDNIRNDDVTTGRKRTTNVTESMFIGYSLRVVTPPVYNIPSLHIHHHLHKFFNCRFFHAVGPNLTTFSKRF